VRDSIAHATAAKSLRQDLSGVIETMSESVRGCHWRISSELVWRRDERVMRCGGLLLTDSAAITTRDRVADLDLVATSSDAISQYRRQLYRCGSHLRDCLSFLGHNEHTAAPW
jgi:hypothetical protein